MKSTAEVVIIGAGVQGLSAAYHLAQMGIRDVVVVEKAFVGAGSSGRSASMLMLQVWTEWQMRFSLYCFERYMHFEDELGVSPDYRRIGTLSLADASVEAQESALVDLRRSLGIVCGILPPDELARRFPVLNTDDLRFGVYGEVDGVIEAQSILNGYRAAARRLGVEVCQGTCATGIRLDHGRVAAVETSDGTIQTRRVVNAAGAEAAAVGRWVGVDIPMMNRVRNIYVSDALDAVPDDTPFVWDAAGEWYYRKERPGVLIGVGKRDLPAESAAIDWAFLDQMVDRIVQRVPAFAGVSIVHGWSGIRPLSPDGHPILGPVEGVEGYINDCAWGVEGIMHAPVGGQMVAEYIRDGTTSTFPLDAFLLSRFSTP